MNFQFPILVHCDRVVEILDFIDADIFLTFARKNRDRVVEILELIDAETFLTFARKNREFSVPDS